MAQVVVLGAGMMGSALTVPLAEAGHEITLVGTHLDASIIASLRDTGVHPTLGLTLPASVRAATHDAFAEAAQDAELLVVGVSSAGVRWAGQMLAPVVRPDVPVVMITKGLDLVGGELVTFPDVLEASFPGSARGQVRPAAIAGPCIAGELARRVPTCVVLTGRDPVALRRLQELLTTAYYRPFVSHDIVGVEVAAALKNAYALGVAFGAGLHERAGGSPGPVAMHNHESAVFAQAAVEMQLLVGALGGDPRTVLGLAGVGDLHVTCNGGRTGRFGRLLGAGQGLAAALAALPGVTLECREILRVVRAARPLLEARGRVPPGSLPLLDHLAAVALDGDPVAVPFERCFGP